MKKRKNSDYIKIFIYCIFIFCLLFVIYKTSYVIYTNSFVQNIEIDDETSSYLSFVYVDDNTYSIEVSDPKIMKDFRGKHLFGKDRFDFDVSIPKDSNLKNVSYDIVVWNNGESVSDKYVKFYLTDQNNKPVSGYEKKVPVLDSFDSVVDGKVIYSGVLRDGDLSHKFRLRIWVSNNYDRDIENVLSYDVKIRINDK